MQEKPVIPNTHMTHHHPSASPLLRDRSRWPTSVCRWRSTRTTPTSAGRSRAPSPTWLRSCCWPAGWARCASLHTLTPPLSTPPLKPYLLPHHLNTPHHQPHPSQYLTPYPQTPPKSEGVRRLRLCHPAVGALHGRARLLRIAAGAAGAPRADLSRPQQMLDLTAPRN